VVEERARVGHAVDAVGLRGGSGGGREGGCARDAEGDERRKYASEEVMHVYLPDVKLRSRSAVGFITAEAQHTGAVLAGYTSN
jgi:hypothetical protein